MKKIKVIYLVFLIVIGLIIVVTYSTFALFTTSVEVGEIDLDTELKYTFKINSNQEFTIGANSKLRFNAIIENDMEGAISYGVYYKMISPEMLLENLTIAEVSDNNILTTSGPIENGEDNNITIPLVIINDSNEDVVIQIGVRTGYYTDTMLPENIIYESGETLITDIIDSETAGSYQCEASQAGDCTEDCYTKYENGYKNTYCDTTCISEKTDLTESIVHTNLDQSGANIPELIDGLIPVRYNGTTWVTADSSNSNTADQWYDYNNQMWANAVLVTESKRNSLTKNADGSYAAGQTIGDTESAGVLAFYVWIPRFKYKVWNINKSIGTSSYENYNPYANGIDIEFIGNDKEGTITCNYYFTRTASSTVANEECQGSNGEYYTHPAFKFGNENLTGIWVGKFELSSSNPAFKSYGGGNSTTLTPRVLPNVTSWRYNYLSNFWKVIYDMQKTSNIYGLTTSRTEADSHMITNIEWGAVAYLAYSKYGLCSNDVCSEIGSNIFYDSSDGGSNSYTYGSTRTGCGDGLDDYLYGYTLVCNAYTTATGMLASTTGNIYGIYDMSGGAYEYVMANISSASGNYTYYASSAGSSYSYIGYEKYVTTYSYGTSYNDQVAFYRTRLGDGIGEVYISSSDYAWYGDWIVFLKDGTSGSWLFRGGNYSPETIDYNGLFASNTSNGSYSKSYSTRPSLLVFD